MRRFGRKLEVDRLRSEAAARRRSSSTSCGATATTSSTGPRASGLRRSRTQLPPQLVIPRIVTADVGRGRRVPRRRAGARVTRGSWRRRSDAPYEAGRRGASWLKIKRAHTLDLVVLAAEWGSGRREGWLSNLHLGRAGPGHRRLRDARQDVQGADRRDARVADRGVPRARDRPRRAHRARPAGDRRRRSRSTICRRVPHYPGGLALRFARREALSPGQDAPPRPTRSRRCARCTTRRCGGRRRCEALEEAPGQGTGDRREEVARRVAAGKYPRRDTPGEASRPSHRPAASCGAGCPLAAQACDDQDDRAHDDARREPGRRSLEEKTREVGEHRPAAQAARRRSRFRFHVSFAWQIRPVGPSRASIRRCGCDPDGRGEGKRAGRFWQQKGNRPRRANYRARYAIGMTARRPAGARRRGSSAA